MKKKKKTLEEISASIKRYCDTLTEEERAENLAWGEFISSQFALISDEYMPRSRVINSCASKEFQPNVALTDGATDVPRFLLPPTKSLRRQGRY